MAYQEVVVALIDRPQAFDPLKRFAKLLGHRNQWAPCPYCLHALISDVVC